MVRCRGYSGGFVIVISYRLDRVAEQWQQIGALSQRGPEDAVTKAGLNVGVVGQFRGQH